MKKKELQEKIIKVAKEFLNKKDYHEVVIDEVAKKAGVAKGTIFFYFKTKENFIKEIFKSEIEELCAMVENVAKQNLPTIEKLKLLYDNYADNVLKKIHLFMMLRKEMVCQDYKIHSLVKTEYKKIAEKLIPIVEQGYKEGVFKKYTTNPLSSEIITSMVFTYGLSVAHFVVETRGKKDYNKIKEIFWQILLHGIMK
ncbi:MAG: TetR/AcrR family transcriptional regulator [Endomicrobiia bacterium]